MHPLQWRVVPEGVQGCSGSYSCTPSMHPMPTENRLTHGELTSRVQNEPT